MYKDAIKEHAYQCAMNNLEDDYVPLDEFIAEQGKVEVFYLLGGQCQWNIMYCFNAVLKWFYPVVFLNRQISLI